MQYFDELESVWMSEHSHETDFALEASKRISSSSDRCQAESLESIFLPCDCIQTKKDGGQCPFATVIRI
jgi:hypothetical protein